LTAIGCIPNPRDQRLQALLGLLGQHFNLGLIFCDVVVGQDAAPEDVWIDHRATSDDAARIQHGIAADFRVVAEHGAEFAQAGVEGFAILLHDDVALKEFDVGNFYTCAEVGFVAENGIADVIEMRRAGVVEEDRIFNLARIAHDAAVAKDDVFAEIGVVADLAVPADDGWPLDHHAVLEHRAFADKNVLADVRYAFAGVIETMLHVRGEVTFNFFEGVPGILAAVKDRGVFGLRKVKQIGWLEHARKLSERGATGKGNAMPSPMKQEHCFELKSPHPGPSPRLGGEREEISATARLRIRMVLSCCARFILRAVCRKA
jgi:hypothetical protein